MTGIGWIVLAAFIFGLTLQAALPVLRRQQMVDNVRRLRRLEETLGKTHPDVKALRVRIWRFMLYGEESLRYRP
ncbi:MAG: hypothetical protein WD535_00125 [Thermaerobacterales bacterium]